MPNLPFLSRSGSRLGSVPRRWWLVGMVVIALGAGAWYKVTPAATSTTQSITATVTRGTYKTTVSATGTITPVHTADLSFSSSGVVTRVAVSVGDKVRKGDVLARIDDTALIAQRDAATAQVTAAQAQLSGDSGSSTAQLTADRASLASAKSQLTQATAAVANATLTAPFTGTISAVGVAVGDQAGGSQNQAASTGSGSTAAVSLISPNKLLVDANVSASDVATLKKGMQAEITPTGGGSVIYGTVSDIGVIATASNTGAAQFPVTIEVTGTPTGLYPGSSATVAITIKQATNVLTVPTQAVHSSGTSTYVYVLNGTTRTKKTVTLGTSYGMQTEVLSGLKEGDTVEVLSFTRPTGTTRSGNTGNLPGGGQFGGGTFPGGGTDTGGGGPVLSTGGQ